MFIYTLICHLLFFFVFFFFYKSKFSLARDLGVRVFGALSWNFARTITMIQGSWHANMKLIGGVLALNWPKTWFSLARDLQVRVFGALSWNFARSITVVQGSRHANMKLNGGVLAVFWVKTWFSGFSIFGLCAWGLNQKVVLYPPWDIDNDNWCLYTP